MKWPFGPNRTLLTRAQLHSYENLSIGGEEDPDNIKYNNIYTMNQWKFIKGNWENIDTDKTSILSVELTDNTNRVAKWAIQSLLAGADKMKIVFATRQKLGSNLKHKILGASSVTTSGFIDLISFKIDEAWAYVKYFVDYFEKKEDGNYILVRDPMKTSIKIFKINGEAGKDNQEDEFNTQNQ
jgi:translation initiation factor 3 subunit D